MSDTNRIHAVAFDLDGLMVNTEELYTEVCDELLKRRGFRATADLLGKMMGRKNVDALQVMIDWHQLDTTPTILLEENDQIFHQLLEDRLETMPGLLPLLEQLERSNIPKAITTSGRAAYVERVLTQLGLADRFQFRITAEDVEHGKPAPEIYLKAAEQFGIANVQMAVLEDSDIGGQAAVAAGSVLIAVPSKFNEQHRFDGARAVVGSLSDPRVLEVLGIHEAMR